MRSSVMMLNMLDMLDGDVGTDRWSALMIDA